MWVPPSDDSIALGVSQLVPAEIAAPRVYLSELAAAGPVTRG